MMSLSVKHTVWHIRKTLWNTEDRHIINLTTILWILTWTFYSVSLQQTYRWEQINIVNMCKCLCDIGCFLQNLCVHVQSSTCVCMWERKCMPAEDSAVSVVGSHTQSVCPCCVRSHPTPPFPTPCRGLWLPWKPHLRRKLGLPPP